MNARICHINTLPKKCKRTRKGDPIPPSGGYFKTASDVLCPACQAKVKNKRKRVLVPTDSKATCGH